MTIVIHHKEQWFAQPVFRTIVEKEWLDLRNRFPTIRWDEFVVMPNHDHFIIWLNPPDDPPGPSAGAQLNCAPANADSDSIGQPFTVDPDRPALGQIIRAFKAAITRQIQLAGGTDFAWQRNYHERIVRDERNLNTLRRYVHQNLVRWACDRKHAR